MSVAKYASFLKINSKVFNMFSTTSSESRVIEQVGGPMRKIIHIMKTTSETMSQMSSVIFQV